MPPVLTPASIGDLGGAGVSAYAATLLDDANAAAARSTLGVIIGTDVQKRVASASVYRATDQTGIVDSTWTDIDFDTKYWDDLTAFDLSTNAFTTPAAGRVRVHANADITAASLLTSYLRVNKNAGTVIGYTGGAAASALLTQRLVLNTGWRICAANDTFEVQVFIDVTASTGTIEGDAAGVTAATFEFVAD